MSVCGDHCVKDTCDSKRRANVSTTMSIVSTPKMARTQGIVEQSIGTHTNSTDESIGSTQTNIQARGANQETECV